jgi:hypothetical protein
VPCALILVPLPRLQTVGFGVIAFADKVGPGRDQKSHELSIHAWQSRTRLITDHLPTSFLLAEHFPSWFSRSTHQSVIPIIRRSGMKI